MNITHKTRFALRLQRAVFLITLLSLAGVTGWLSTRHHIEADWTANGRHTLSEAGKALLNTFDQPVSITVYARENENLRQPVAELLERFSRESTQFNYRFKNPDAVPDEVRDRGISHDGEMIIEHQGREEHLSQPDEQGLINALQRVARSNERWAVFLQGHGERDPFGDANHDLGDWGKQLENRGLKVRTLNLATTAAIPANTSVLVLAGPRTTPLAGELSLIADYLDAGGNMLWLADPDENEHLEAIATLLGIHFEPGIIVDPSAQLLGIDNPAIVLIAQYSTHELTRGFEFLTLFPEAVAINSSDSEWRAEPLLVTNEAAWSETSPLQDGITFDETSDLPGPLNIAITLTRPLPNNEESTEESGGAGRTQRVVITGDGDFLTNSYLGNSGNLDLGIRMLNWLSADDTLINIPARTATDLQLEMPTSAIWILGVGLLLVLPLTLLLTGATIWWRRRKA